MAILAEIIFSTKNGDQLHFREVLLPVMPKINEILAFNENTYRIIRKFNEDYRVCDGLKVVGLKQEIDIEGDPEPGKQIGPPECRLLVSVVPTRSMASIRAGAKYLKEVRAKQAKSNKKK